MAFNLGLKPSTRLGCPLQRTNHPVPSVRGQPSRQRLNAVKREFAPAFFSDVHMVLEDKVMESGLLPKTETLLMLESVKSVEQLQKAVSLITKHVSTNAEAQRELLADWPMRKKWYKKICELSIELNCQDVMFQLLGDVEKYQISTYFSKELIRDLGEQGVNMPTLQKILEVNKSQRLPGDKGVKGAYMELLKVMKDRKEEQLYKSTRLSMNGFIGTAVTAVPSGTVKVRIPELVVARAG